MKFNNIRLLVNDFDRSFAFYKDILGLNCSWGKPGDNFASFDIGIPSGLCLFKADLMEAVTGADQEAKQTRTTPDKMAIVIEVQNLDQTCQSLKDKGLEFITMPVDMPVWGIRVAHFRDPENNLIELYTELSGTST